MFGTANTGGGNTGGGFTFGGGGAKPLATPAAPTNKTGGGGLFSSTPSATTTANKTGGGGLFGSTPSATTTANKTGGGGLFGSTPASTTKTSTTTTGGGGLFGSTSATTTNTTATTAANNTGGGLFGSAPATTTINKSGGGLFGSTPAPTSTNKTGTGGTGVSFGATNSSATTTKTGGGGLFGGTGATANTASSSNNNNNNNTALTFGKTATANSLKTNNNSNNDAQKTSQTSSMANAVTRSKGNNYVKSVHPREVQQLFLPNFYAQRHSHNMLEENRLMTLGSNGHLIERIRLLKEKISLAHGNAMQHMFYRAALADSTGAVINECHPQYRQWYFRLITEQPQMTPGPRTSNHPEFFRAIRPNYWREAGSIENIEGIPVLPDPIQGLEQLRDYIRIRTGSLIKIDTRLNRKNGAPGSLGNVGIGSSDNVGTNNNVSARINILHLQENVKTLSGVLDSLKSDCSAYMERSNNIRKRHWKLRHRLVKIIGLVKMRHNWNGPTTNDDVYFREKLNYLTNRLVQPNSFRAQLQDLEMELKITHSATSKQRAPVLNNMDMARLYEFLEKQHSGLAELTNVLKKDARDIGIIINSIQ
jgi:hypothetical protein